MRRTDGPIAKWIALDFPGHSLTAHLTRPAPSSVLRRFYHAVKIKRVLYRTQVGVQSTLFSYIGNKRGLTN